MPLISRDDHAAENKSGPLTGSSMTQSQVAKKMGYENVNGYQRLERRKCNPNLKTLSKIKEIFPDFSLDLAVV